MLIAVPSLPKDDGLPDLDVFSGGGCNLLDRRNSFRAAVMRGYGDQL